MDQKQYPKPHIPTATILTVIIAVGIIAGGAYAYNSFFNKDPRESFVSPQETVKQFYTDHINYEGNPLVDRHFAQSEFASQELISKIDATIASFQHGGYDPVLCAQDIPSSVTFTNDSQDDNTAKVTVAEKFGDMTKNVGVNLTATNEGWKITNIDCGSSSNNNQNSVQTKVGDYIRENISDLSEEKAVLGGTFYVTKISFLDNTRALVEYEDGHIALAALAKYSIGDDEKVNITSFKDISGNFEKTGNLTTGNPGQKANTWYLVYEKPGQPGLSAELVFGPESVCVNGNKAELCIPGELNAGDRVKVTGQLTGNKLDVMTMTTVE